MGTSDWAMNSCWRERLCGTSDLIFTTVTELREELILFLLLKIEILDSKLALGEAFGRVEDLLFDHERCLPSFHPLCFVGEAGSLRPHSMDVLVLMLQLHNQLVLLPVLVMRHVSLEFMDLLRFHFHRFDLQLLFLLLPSLQQLPDSILLTLFMI